MMINFGYSLGFMDYAAFVVIVAVYFVLMIYLNKGVNRDVNKIQLESSSEWNVEEKHETFLSGGFLLAVPRVQLRMYNFFCTAPVAVSNVIKYSSWMILLGICSDVYENGIEYLVFFSVGSSFMTIFMNFIILPVLNESEAATLSEVS